MLFIDPWAARDGYLAFTLRAERHQGRLARSARPAGRSSSPSRDRALAYLELQRNAQLMYTSCGWFFADISGIETVQIMKYAQRALDLMDELELESPRERFLDLLAEAQSNLPEMGNGADVFRRFVEPLRVHPGTGRGARRDLEPGRRRRARPAIAARLPVPHARASRKQRHGRLILATAHIELEERATEQRHELRVAAMHFGGVDFYCVVRPFTGEQRFVGRGARLWANFRTASLPMMLRIAQEEFGPDEFGLESLLPEGRQPDLGDGASATSSATSRTSTRGSTRTTSACSRCCRARASSSRAELLAAAEFTFSRRFEDAIRARGREPRAARLRAGPADRDSRPSAAASRSTSARRFRS